MLVLLLATWSISAYAQDLTSCGTGYFMDLSVGYTPTSLGLESCGCSEETSDCELVHIIMQSSSGEGVNLLDCPEISLTERWWREKKDLVDIYDPLTCEEYEESESHMDRYILATDHLEPGDTLSILVCKTDPEDPNVIELSATPGTECSTYTCAPQMSCPVEVSLHPDAQCRYTVPDFTGSIILRDTCVIPPAIVTADYTLMQNPPPGTEITDPLFVEIEVASAEGEIIATCDVSILFATNTPPIIESPNDLQDIIVGEALPTLQDIYAIDTVGLGILQQIPAFGFIDPYTRDDCEGYKVTYRWIATDGCGATSETSVDFDVLPDTQGPSFVSLPSTPDTVLAGEDLPALEILEALNPDGTPDGVEVTSSTDPFTIDDCHGYDVTYRWIAVDSCGDETTVTTDFFVEPNGAPPVFISEPMVVPNIYASDSLPIAEDLIAVSAQGSSEGIQIMQSFEILDGDPCDSVEIVYTWVATDTCGLSSDVSTSFFMFPDTLSGFVTAGIEDMMVELSVECTETAQISVPIDLDRFTNHIVTVIITDDDWMVLDEYIYTGPEDYEFGTGNFHVIYNIADQCGNSVSDTINIQAADVSAPLFICTDDHFIVLTDFNSCSAVADWTLPIVQDNCDDVTLAQIAGPTYGDSVSVGTYEIIYEATDLSGNSSNCAFMVTVASTDLTTFDCQPIDIHVDTACQALLSLDAILGNEVLECQPDFDLVVITDTDTLEGVTIDVAPFLGQTLFYQICDPQTGVCCSNEISLRDTIAPVLTCGDTISIPCLQDPEEYRPDVFQECSDITWRVRDLAFVEVCDDSQVIANITREFIAFDAEGNASEPCVVIIQVTFLDLIDLHDDDMLLWPADTTISCEDYDPSDFERQTLGVPRLDPGLTTLSIESACSITVFPTDRIVVEQGCETIIERTWTMVQGTCSDNQQEITDVQIIRVVDNQAPTATILADTFRVFTSEEDCYGYFNVGSIPISLSDNCQSEEDLTWSLVLGDDLVLPIDSLPVHEGYNQVIIALRDNCGNIGYDTLHVKVRDNIRPVAACLEHTVISIADDEVYYPVEALNIGSYDNCELGALLVRKVNRTCPSEDSRFKDHVKICCEDVGDTITLTLKVIDHVGNENFCTGKVIVQDKLAPTIVCPPDIVVSCTLDLEAKDEADPYGHIFGRVTGYNQRQQIYIREDDLISADGEMLDGYAEDNCGTPDQIIVETREDLDDCGFGFIYRSFTAVDQFDNRSETCTQTVEIRSGAERLDSLRIKFPIADTTITSCEINGSIDPAVLGKPWIPRSSCILSAVSYEDTYLNASDILPGTCIKVLRTWTIVDWCDPNPLENVIIYRQIIKLSDQEAPIITSCSSEIIAHTIPADDCENIDVRVTNRAIDDCVASSSLNWTIDIDQYGDGQFEKTLEVDPDSVGQVEALLKLPVGHHHIYWTAKDPCGNETTCRDEVLVENSKAPVPIAKGVATSLDENGEVEIWATDVIIKSEHPCNPEVRHLISRADQDVDEASTNLTFTCADLGMQDLKAYAAIEQSDGTMIYDAVHVSIAIRDGAGTCDATSSNFNGQVSGIIYLEDGRLVPDVELSLHQSFTNDHMSNDTTGSAGLYDLGTITDDISYYVTPQLEGDPTAGLTTLDMILIQRHLLGLVPFDSPYKIIASDINRDQRVSSLDLLHLRRALLFRDSDLNIHPHWRFVNDQLHFVDKRYPMEQEIPAEIFVTYYNPILDLVAVKMGDVNESIELPNDHLSSTRSSIGLTVSDRALSPGEEVIMDVRLPLSTTIHGFQMTIRYDAEMLRLNNLIGYTDSDLDFEVLEPGLLLVTSIGSAKLKKREALVYLNFQSLSTGRLSEFVDLDDGPLKAEIYTKDLSTQSLLLNFIESKKEQDHWTLNSVVPNPFNDQTTLSIDLDEASEMTLIIYDITGRLVYKQNKQFDSGTHELIISSDELPKAGVYTYRLSSQFDHVVGKLIYSN